MATIDDVYAYLQKNEPQIANSICYASEMLLTALNDGIVALRKKRTKAAEEDRDEDLNMLTQYRDVMNDYIKTINGYLDYQSKSKKMPVESHLNISSSIKIDYDKYRVNNSIPHSLNEDYTYKKICAFMYSNIKYNVTDWASALIAFCNILSQKGKDFNKLVEEPAFHGRKVQYFCYNSIPSKNAHIQLTNVYVWTNLSANAIVQLIKKVLVYFGENPDAFYIFLKKDLTTLHAENNEVISNGATDEKIGKYVIRTLRDLEAKNYRFSDEMLSVLLDDKKSNIVFGITYAFFTDSMDKTIDKHNRSRYWKKPFFFNGQHFYVTSQWYEYNRKRFEAWLNSLSTT